MKSNKDIVEFLKKNNISLTSNGCYNFPDDVIIKALDEFCDKGKTNLIKKHQDWMWGCWDLKDEWKIGQYKRYFTLKELTKLKRLKKFWCDDEDLELLNNLISDMRVYEEIRKTYKFKRRGGFKQILKKSCLSRDDNKCVSCGAREHLEIDHIKEIIDGGDNILENLQTLCHTCHRNKTNSEIKKRKKYGTT